jgi:hypothetical protein
MPVLGEPVTQRWTFGDDPLPQTRRTAALLRDVTGLVLALEEEDPAVDGLIAALERAKADLTESVPADATPRVGEAASGDGRVYLDHAFDIGAYNPCFPEYAIEVDGEQARGTVTFPVAYEGPPGLVHGGFLALFFDCVAQHHNCEVGVAGKTTSLALRFRRPTPLLTPLTFTLERSVKDDRIHSSGSLSVDDAVACQAEVDAIAGVRSNLPEVSPRREISS